MTETETQEASRQRSCSCTVSAVDQEGRQRSCSCNVNADSQESKKNRQWLNNYATKRRLVLKWEDNDQLVPGNTHIWTSTVQVNGTPYGKGQGSTKGAAKELAAEEALAALEDEYGPHNGHHD